MSNPAEQGRYFDEDIAISSSATYATGGITLSVTKAAVVERVIGARFKAGGTTYLVGAAVPGSESGQSFKYRVYASVGASGFTELANGATIGAGTVTVDYEGT